MLIIVVVVGYTSCTVQLLYNRTITILLRKIIHAYTTTATATTTVVRWSVARVLKIEILGWTAVASWLERAPAEFRARCFDCDTDGWIAGPSPVPLAPPPYGVTRWKTCMMHAGESLQRYCVRYSHIHYTSTRPHVTPFFTISFHIIKHNIVDNMCCYLLYILCLIILIINKTIYCETYNIHVWIVSFITDTSGRESYSWHIP